jgi:PAS domain S-box-containing protein
MQNSENNKEPLEQADTTSLPEKISGHKKSEGPASAGRRAYKETIRLFIKMLVTIFLCEAAIMVFLHFLSLKRGWNIVADPLLLTILGTPILYWLLVRPIWLVLEQRNLAIEELKSEKNFAEALIKTTQVIILLLDEEGRIEHFNPYMERVSGYRLEEVKGKDWFTAFLPEHDQKRIRELFFKARSGIQTKGNINPIVTKDGRQREIEWSDKILTDTNGNVVGLLSTGQDITERKKAAEAVCEKEEQLDNLLSNVDAVILEGDPFDIYYVGGQVEKILGYPKEQWFSEPGGPVAFWSKIIHPNDKDKIDICRQAITNCENHSFEYRMIASDGREVWFYDAVTVESQNGEPIKTRSVMIDITERKKAEETLRESEGKYRSIFETAANLITSVNEKGVIVECNNRAREVLGYEPDELIGQPMSKIIPPEYLGKAQKGLNEILTEGYSYNNEYKMVRKDGTLVEVATNSSGLKDENGRYVRTICIIDDISERKKTEKELEKQKYYLERAQDIGRIGTWELDIEKNILVWTDENYRIFGVPKGTELTYEIFLDRVHPDDRGYVDKKWKAALNKEPYDIEHRLLVDGELRWVREKAEVEFDENGNCICGIGFTQDITERKKAERKLLDYQAKLKSLASQLSLTEESERRRIAIELHDQIGQGLVFSKIKLDELHQSATSSELTKALDEICNNIGKIIQDTRSLTFDLSSPILNELGFEAAVGEWLDVQVGAKHGIETEFVDDGQQKPLDEDIRALLFRNVRELLVNIVKHAKAHKVKVSIGRVNEHIHIDVEDDGKGFDSAKVISTAIEDTKFGLFSIRQRLEQLGGQFEIDSEPGRGSKITMTAPLKLTKSPK